MPEPLRSANSTVICLRSPSTAALEVRIFSARCFGACVSGDGGFETMRQVLGERYTRRRTPERAHCGHRTAGLVPRAGCRIRRRNLSPRRSRKRIARQACRVQVWLKLSCSNPSPPHLGPEALYAATHSFGRFAAEAERHVCPTPSDDRAAISVEVPVKNAARGAIRRHVIAPLEQALHEQRPPGWWDRASFTPQARFTSATAVARPSGVVAPAARLPLQNHQVGRTICALGHPRTKSTANPARVGTAGASSLRNTLRTHAGTVKECQK